MPDQNNPTQKPNPVIPPADAPVSPVVPPIISPQVDLPPLSPDFQKLPEDGTSATPPADSGNGSAAPPDISSVIPKAKKKFGSGKIIATILGLFLLIGGVGAGIVLTQQQQLFQQKASGTACQDCLAQGNTPAECSSLCTATPAPTPYCSNSTKSDCVDTGCIPDLNGGTCKQKPAPTCNPVTRNTCQTGQPSCVNGVWTCPTPAPTPYCSNSTKSDCVDTGCIPDLNGGTCKIPVATPYCSSTTVGNCKPDGCTPDTNGGTCKIPVATPYCSSTTVGNCKPDGCTPDTNGGTCKIPSPPPTQPPPTNASPVNCVTPTNPCGGGGNCRKWVCPQGDTNGDGKCQTGDTGASYTDFTDCSNVSCGNQCCQIDWLNQPGGGYCTQAKNCKEIKLDCSTTTAPPTALPTAPSCIAVKTYNSNNTTDNTGWTFIPETQLPSLAVGATVNFCVSGNAASGTFDKAQFMINTVLKDETKTQRPGSNDFCQAYTILSTDTTVSVRAKIHHSTEGWVGESI